MSYIGTPPSNAFTSLLKQDFSTSATTGYTLDHAVNNANDIALFINFVRQEPTAGYAASGTSLVLTSATASSDDMYCVYLGQALQTVNPPNASVGASQIVDSSIALGKLSATGTKDATTFLRGDNTFASAGGANTPLFRVHQSSALNIDHNTATKIPFNAETFDPQNTFDNGKFTPAVSGKYFLSASVRLSAATYNQLGLIIYKNGSGIAYQWHNTDSSSGNPSATVSTVVDSDTNDYFEIYFYHYKGSTAGVTTGSENTWFNGFKLIT